MADPETRTCRQVYYVSDGTAITAQTIGRSLLTQFESHYVFDDVLIPFIDDSDKAQKVAERIAAEGTRGGELPIVFSTFVSEELDRIVRTAPGVHIAVFHELIPRLEAVLGVPARHTRGLAHGVSDFARYMRRIDAMNFALLHDDGLTPEEYGKCDVIIVGISRVGKTPTSLYLALQHGLFVANYPFALEDLEAQTLPRVLRPYRSRLIGLTVHPERLQTIRQARRPNSDYASPRRVMDEIAAAEGLMRSSSIPVIDTTEKSVEEIASTILQYHRAHVPHGF